MSFVPMDVETNLLYKGNRALPLFASGTQKVTHKGMFPATDFADLVTITKTKDKDLFRLC